MKSLVDYITESVKQIQGIKAYTYTEVVDIVKGYCEEIIEDNSLDITIAEVWLHGSRLRGNAKSNSDLDVVLFYKGDDKEDAIFNIFHDEDTEPLEIEDIQIDINPIKITSNKDIETYKKKSVSYDREVSESINEARLEVNMLDLNKVRKVSKFYKKLDSTKFIDTELAAKMFSMINAYIAKNVSVIVENVQNGETSIPLNLPWEVTASVKVGMDYYWIDDKRHGSINWASIWLSNVIGLDHSRYDDLLEDLSKFELYNNIEF